MSSVKKEIENIVKSGKNIGSAYKDTGIAIGESYRKAGKKTAKIFKDLYDSDAEDSTEDESQKRIND